VISDVAAMYTRTHARKQDRREWVNVSSSTSSPGQFWTKGRKMFVVVVVIVRSIKYAGTDLCMFKHTARPNTSQQNSIQHFYWIQLLQMDIMP